MWQLFDALDDFCAWYEPLHPQLLAAVEVVKPKKDHLGIEDYWAVYRAHPEFKKTYSSELATHQLYLDDRSDYPALKKHIEHLIALSAPAVPVLQFNRVDLRLSWLRKHFPTARIIHMDRNPLQLYHSQRKHISPELRDVAGHWDAYELMPWCHALFWEFPFLLDTKQTHAFYPFYGLYQLSKIIADLHVDVTINLEKDVFQSDDFIEKINQVVPLNTHQKDTMISLCQVPDSIELDEEFTVEMTSIMTAIDTHIQASGLLDNLGQRSLASIKIYFADYWDAWSNAKYPWQAVQQNIIDLQHEVTRIENENFEFLARIGSKPQPAEKRRTATIEMLHPDQINEHSHVGHLMNQINHLNSIMTYLMADNQALRNQLPEETQNKPTDVDVAAESSADEHSENNHSHE